MVHLKIETIFRANSSVLFFDQIKTLEIYIICFYSLIASNNTDLRRCLGILKERRRGGGTKGGREEEEKPGFSKRNLVS